jgi:hypothetical protein
MGTTADILSGAAELIRKSGPAIKSGLEIVRDPYFPEVLCLAQSISDTRSGKPASPCPRTPPTTKGFGLRAAILPIRVLDFHVKNPVVLPLLTVGVLGLIYYAGYTSGKSKRGKTL